MLHRTRQTHEADAVQRSARPADASPGKVTHSAQIQCNAEADPAAASAVHAAASQGVSGGGGALPHGATIQALFGRHDVSGVRAHTDGAAAAASAAVGEHGAARES